MHLDEIIQQKTHERIVFFLRRHPLVFLAEVAVIAGMMLIPAAAYLLISAANPELLTGAFSRPILTLLASAYLLNIWLFFLSKFVDYYLDAWIVTNDRILNIEQRGLFSRTVSELDLARIQDVTSEVSGIIPSIFDYGDVHVQTAGEVGRFVFEQVKSPHDIRKQILDLVEADRKRQGETAAGAVS